MGNLLFLTNNNSIKIIGIAGGTGSGKTYLANILIKKFGYNNIDKIEVDAYYKDLSHLSMEQRIQNNFDHPESFDFESLIKDLNYLKNGENINIPVYDYKTHTRRKKKNLINKKYSLVLLEGILSLFSILLDLLLLDLPFVSDFFFSSTFFFHSCRLYLAPVILPALPRTNTFFFKFIFW